MSRLQQMSNIKVVIVGVKGSIGNFLAKQFVLSNYQVVGIDITPLDTPLVGVEFIQADIIQPSLMVQKTLQKAKIVVFALSQEVIQQTLPTVKTHLPVDCLLVDTLSIKSDFRDLLIEQEIIQPVIGINPMFSGDLEPSDRPVAVVIYRQGVIIDNFLSLLETWQLDVITMDADEHDREMALLQSLCHAVILSFGKVLSSAQLSADSINALAPPPFRVLLALVARMTQNHPNVYWEIQTDNRYANSVRKQLFSALTILDTNTNLLKRDNFYNDILKIKSKLIDSNPSLTQLCKKIFDITNEPDDKGKYFNITSRSENKMTEFRKKIDDLDNQIITLLGCRFNIIRQVAKKKKSCSIPVMQPQRVIEVKQRCSEYGKQHELRPEFVDQLYQFIIDEACHIEYEYVRGE